MSLSSTAAPTAVPARTVELEVPAEAGASGSTASWPAGCRTCRARGSRPCCATATSRKVGSRRPTRQGGSTRASASCSSSRRRGRADPAPEERELRVLYEDAHLIVLVKPAGVVVHPAPGHSRRHAGQRAAGPLQGQPVGHRRGRAAGDRAPARQARSAASSSSPSTTAPMSASPASSASTASSGCTRRWSGACPAPRRARSTGRSAATRRTAAHGRGPRRRQAGRDPLAAARGGRDARRPDRGQARDRPHPPDPRPPRPASATRSLGDRLYGARPPRGAQLRGGGSTASCCMPAASASCTRSPASAWRSTSRRRPSSTASLRSSARTLW